MPSETEKAELTFRGACYCGAVSYIVSGSPLLSSFCHCTICQRLTGSPFVHTLHFERENFQWTHDEPHEDQLDSFPVTDKPWKTRFRCKNCGVCITSHNSKSGQCSVWAAHLERDRDGRIRAWQAVKPTAHIFYGTRLLDIHDNLGKWEGYENKSTRLE